MVRTGRATFSQTEVLAGTTGPPVLPNATQLEVVSTLRYQKEKLGGKIPFTLATRKIKYLAIKLTKEIKHLLSEIYKTMKKEIEEDTNKWKHIPCSWIERINIIKMSILPKSFIDSLQSNTNDIFHIYRTNISKPYMEQ